MTPEEKELLHRSVALSEENNDILRSIQRTMRMGHFFNIIYWIIIIGIAVGAFYFLKPYWTEAQNIYTSVKAEFGSMTNFFNTVKQAGK